MVQAKGRSSSHLNFSGYDIELQKAEGVQLAIALPLLFDKHL
jgi:hypothetical protein